MAGLLGKVARFASSPQGRRLMAKAKDAATDPKNRAKVEQAARSLRSKGKPPLTASTPPA